MDTLPYELSNALSKLKQAGQEDLVRVVLISMAISEAKTAEVRLHLIQDLLVPTLEDLVDMHGSKPTVLLKSNVGSVISAPLPSRPQGGFLDSDDDDGFGEEDDDYEEDDEDIQDLSLLDPDDLCAQLDVDVRLISAGEIAKKIRDISFSGAPFRQTLTDLVTRSQLIPQQKKIEVLGLIV